MEEAFKRFIQLKIKTLTHCANMGEFKGPLHRFYTESSVDSSHGVPLSLWNGLYNVLCGSEESFLKFEKTELNHGICSFRWLAQIWD